MLTGLGRIWDVAGEFMQANVISEYDIMQLGLFVRCAMMHLSGLTSVHSSSVAFKSIKIQLLILAKVQ